MEELKRDLEGWRQALLPLRSILVWEKPYHPAILFGATTLLFALFWCLEPSVMTTVGVLGLVVTTTDFAVLFGSPYVFSSQQWTGREEQQFEDICGEILQLRTRLHDFVQEMAILKAERPIIYFILMMGSLTTFAWIGYMMDNFLLTYLIVMMIVMLPGLFQRGFIHRYFLRFWFIFKRIMFGRMFVSKKEQ